MTWNEFIIITKSDTFRYIGNKEISLISAIWHHIGLRYTVIMRSLCFCRGKVYFWPLFVLLKLYFARMSVKYGISIPYNTKIGPGLYIGHYGGIVLNHEVVLGSNCNINHGVTIGVGFGGKYPGCPRIGSNVFFGAGCKVFGGIQVGDNVAIGANSVLTKPVPNSAVVVGAPAKIISQKGSGSYVVNKCDD